MKILADENIEREIITALRLAGFEVESIKEIDPGIDDSSVMNIARATEAILLTNDKDFGDLIYRDGLVANGVILLRFGNLPIPQRIERLTSILTEHKTTLLSSFSVVSSQGMRIRKQG